LDPKLLVEMPSFVPPAYEVVPTAMVHVTQNELEGCALLATAKAYAPALHSDESATKGPTPHTAAVLSQLAHRHRPL